MYKLINKDVINNCKYPAEVICFDYHSLIHFAYDYLIIKDSEEYIKSMRMQMGCGFGGKFRKFIFDKVELYYHIRQNDGDYLIL